MNINLKTATQRGHVLQALKLDSPNAVNDQTLLTYLQAFGHASLMELDIRQMLAFLRDEGLIDITKESRSFWLARIKSKGSQLLEGAITEIPGIQVVR